MEITHRLLRITHYVLRITYHSNRRYPFTYWSNQAIVRVQASVAASAT